VKTPHQKRLEAACRSIDELSDSLGGPVEALKELGADPHAVIAVAEQRALRAYAYITDQISEPLDPTAEPIRVRVSDKRLFAALVAAFMDGFACSLAVEPAAEQR
jgi:hypothetical protein